MLDDDEEEEEADFDSDSDDAGAASLGLLEDDDGGTMAGSAGGASSGRLSIRVRQSDMAKHAEASTKITLGRKDVVAAHRQASVSSS